MTQKIPLKGWIIRVAWYGSAGALGVGFVLHVMGSMVGFPMVMGGLCGTISFYMLAVGLDIEQAKKAK